MAKQKAEYEALLEKVTEALKHSPEELQQWVETTEKYRQAASDMTKDELALISAYLKRDLAEFGQNVEESSEPFDESPFYQAVSETIWSGLAEITDKTQLEWREVMGDIQHQGVYQAGEIIGLGNLVCEHCGHHQMYTHVKRLEPCVRCGHEQFTRQPLAP
ncbi:zinc ribbon-containing protein [Photobacterium sanguinicancri]|uniref:zinc ribbon-containing protein n=1 Tax=Photobacterium sanguinicancri TaxID=875932 RepID=UPI0026E47F32|nr:zinc ribbon-containing protein [Photobacterium sanguinicancri]MDO6500846.1 zinc ribbon-containing protein [Photobacterium sanguinicancri]